MALRELPFQAMGGQPAFEPAALDRFVSAARVAVLAYTRRDGSPCQVPIWYAYDGTRFYIVTSSASPKVKALGRSPRASLTVQDEVPPYRAVIIDGETTLGEAPTKGGVTSDLAVRYFGKMGAREYEKMVAEENARTGLTLITFEPRRVRGFDNHRMIGAPLRAYMRLRQILPIPNDWL
jgi:PPOX class probable F420-dependent enzyme